MDAQARRRERRTDKQAEWKAANPLSVGVSANAGRQVLIINRKVDRVKKAAEPICNEMATQIIKATESQQAIRNQIDRNNHRTWYSKPTREMGVTCAGKSRMKLGSKPLI